MPKVREKVVVCAVVKIKTTISLFSFTKHEIVYGQIVRIGRITFVQLSYIAQYRQFSFFTCTCYLEVLTLSSSKPKAVYKHKHRCSLIHCGLIYRLTSYSNRSICAAGCVLLHRQFYDVCSKKLYSHCIECSVLNAHIHEDK